MSEVINIADQTAELFQRLISEVVLEKEALRVRRSINGNAVAIKIDCHESDRCRVIGSKGAFFRSLEMLARCIASNYSGLTLTVTPLAKMEGKPRTKRYREFELRKLEPIRQKQFETLFLETVAAAVAIPSAVAVKVTQDGDF